MNIKTLLLLYICLLFCSCKKEKTLVNNTQFDNYKVYERIADKETYLDSLYNEILVNPNDSVTREWLLQIAYRYEVLELFDKSYAALNHILRLSEEKRDTLHQAKTYRYFGDLYDKQQIPDSSFLYYSKSENLYALSKKDSLSWGRVVLYKAGILYDIGIFSESETETIKALNILSPLKHTRLIYEANIKMTLNLKELKEYDAALKYYEKIPLLLDQLQREGVESKRLNRSWLSYYNNIGGFYDKTAEYSKAANYYTEALSREYVEEYPTLHAMLLNNYAYNRMKATQDNALIDSLLNTSLNIRKEIDHRQGIIASKFRIAEFLMMKKDTLNALEKMSEVYFLSLNEGSNYDIVRSLEFLSKNDRINKDYHTSKYLAVKDSLYQIEKATRNKFARIAYETDLIEEKNAFLIQRNTYLLVIAGIGFILAGATFFIYRLKIKNRELLHQQKEQKNIRQIQDLLLSQQAVSENTRNQERKRIAKDLHDVVLNRIFTTRLNLQETLIEDSNRKKELIEELKKTEIQIREVSHDLYKNFFYQDQDFYVVLENLVLSQKNTFGTKFNFSANKKIDWTNFNLEQKTNIYLILQGLLQNVNIHSHAQECHVFILKKENALILRVHDNGVGFKKDPKTFGLGLTSIKDRISNLKGKMEISSNYKTTIVSLQIPIS